MEPEKGKYSFEVLDHAIKRCREHGLRMSLLWFGTNQGGSSRPAPAWVTGDKERFPRIIDMKGREREGLCPNSRNTLETEMRAFNKLLSHLAEAVYKHIAAFYYQQAASVGYFRGGRKDKEVDIVVNYANMTKIFIEVKYREGAPVSDNDAISELCGEAAAAIVVTKNSDDFGIHNTKSGKIMLRIPAFAFLYLLGHAEKNGYRGIGL